MQHSLGTLREVLTELQWPSDFLDEDAIPAVLDGVAVIDYLAHEAAAGFVCTFWLAFDGELAIPLVASTGAQLVLGDATAGITLLSVTLVLGEPSVLTFADCRIALRIERSALAGDVPSASSERPIEFVLDGAVRIDSNFHVAADDIRLQFDLDGLVDLADTLDVKSFHLDSSCPQHLGRTDVNRWLTGGARSCRSGAAVPAMGLRVVLGDPIQEIRLTGTSPTESHAGTGGFKLRRRAIYYSA